MKILLDCSSLAFKNISGIGVYNKNLFLQLHTQLKDDLTPVLKWSRFHKSKLVEKHIEHKVSLLPPILLDKKSIYHGTDHKINTNSRGPKVVTIHDMQPFTDKWLDPSFAINRKEIITKVLQSDIQKIIAVSHFTKQEILKYFPKLEQKIDVVYHGCNFQKTNAPSELNRIKNIQQDRPFLFFIGNIEERKNLINQIHAFEILKKKIPNLIFIIAGSPGFKFNQIQEAINNSTNIDDIYLLGYLNETEKEYGLKNTSCLMFASWYEGFGIPVIEALAYNSKVLISNADSLVEIAGQYCHQCNPSQIEDIAHQAFKIITEGNIQKVDFNQWSSLWSWEKCANDTFNSYKTIYN